MIFLIAVLLYLVIGVVFYWCSTLEDDGCGIALIVVWAWPMFLIYAAVSVHAGKATVSRGDKKWRRVNGKWERVD